MRTEKELWEVALSHQYLFISGICWCIKVLWMEKLITSKEFDLLDYRLDMSIPYNLKGGDYWWKQGELQPRIEWINERIKQL